MTKPKLLDTRGEVLNPQIEGTEPRIDVPLVAGIVGGIFVNLDAFTYAEPARNGDGIVVYFQGGGSKKFTDPDQALSVLMVLADMTLWRPDPAAAAMRFAPVDEQA